MTHIKLFIIHLQHLLHFVIFKRCSTTISMQIFSAYAFPFDETGNNVNIWPFDDQHVICTNILSYHPDAGNVTMCS